MCGIVGYIGQKQAAPVLMDGLERLSYRGYDSAGIAVMQPNGTMEVRKAKGKLDNLQALLAEQPVHGCMGIGHTRWATHGEPSDINAHPHTDEAGGIAVVHNGIIENHDSLRKYLQSRGVQFVSCTDTEVIAHLLCELYDGDMLRTLLRAMGMLQGSYALGVLCDREPDRLYCARNDSPLVIGFRDGEGYLASDIPALLSHTRDVLFLQDREIGVLSRTGAEVYDACGQPRCQAFFHVAWDATSAQKGGYEHFMLKEIHEQPAALQNTFSPRSEAGEYGWLPCTPLEARSMPRITIAACGTAYHAAVYGKYVLEKLANLPVEAAIASEYRYRETAHQQGEWFIAISQSGETADTLAALHKARQLGLHVLCICNTVGSSLAREAGESHTLYTYAGPEMAVASTKAYVTQAEMLLMLAIALGDLRGVLPHEEARRLYGELAMLPKQAQKALATEEQLHRAANGLCQKRHAFFVGRGLDYALSMEAALKLKEISYLFSEAYAAGELKHGPIALLQPGRLVVVSLTQPQLLEKTLSNLQEMKARGAYVLAVCTPSIARRLEEQSDEQIVIPEADPLIAPLLAAIPLQLFAYCMAVERGCDVDKPRNLAKSVTVE